MADNITIDPNDLDSIDALLDEAELDHIADDPDPSIENDEIGDIEDLADLDLERLDEPEELLDALDEPEKITAEEAAPPDPEPIVPEVTDNTAEQIIEKRARAQAESQATTNVEQELTVAEMDSIKKLIIIFSSVMITLALVGIGIGVWSALSSGGPDEGTLEKFDNIEAGVTNNILLASTTSKAVKSLEKKLDALSFQIEQLNSDLNAVGVESMAKQPAALLDLQPTDKHVKKDAHDVHGKSHADTHSQEHAKPVHKAHAATVAVEPLQLAVDSNVVKKLDKVSAKVSSAQRRIYEVNKRVKSLQVQYKKLLASIKSVEKQLLKEQVAKKPVVKKGTDKSIEKMKSNVSEEGGSHAYEYTSPGGLLEFQDDYYR